MKIAIVIEFGIGEHLCSTVMLRQMRKKYPDAKIAVCAMYSEIFKNNPNIDYLFDFHECSNFYRDFARDADLRYRLCPYLYAPQRRDKDTRHINQVICDMHDVSFEDHNLEFYPYYEEEQEANKFISCFNKPVILLQPSCASDMKNNQRTISTKDWPIEEACKLVDMTKKDFQWILIRSNCEPTIPGAININESRDINSNPLELVSVPSLRSLITLVKYCHSFVVVDSCIQHASAIWKKKGIVLWGRSNPEGLGYSHNINILKEDSCKDICCGRPEGHYLDVELPTKRLSNGALQSWNCLDKKCMREIKAEEIVKNLYVIF